MSGTWNLLDGHGPGWFAFAPTGELLAVEPGPDGNWWGCMGDDVLTVQPDADAAKLALTQNMYRTGEFVGDVLGAKMVADSGEWGTYAWAQFVMGIPGMRIAGGSDEVMRNIVGERVLGLPKDAGIDSTTPFRDLKVGTQAKA